jgi:hypothetical protein
MTTKNATRRILRHFLAVFIAKMGISYFEAKTSHRGSGAV